MHINVETTIFCSIIDAVSGNPCKKKLWHQNPCRHIQIYTNQNRQCFSYNARSSKLMVTITIIVIYLPSPGRAPGLYTQGINLQALFWRYLPFRDVKEATAQPTAVSKFDLLPKLASCLLRLPNAFTSFLKTFHWLDSVAKSSFTNVSDSQAQFQTYSVSDQHSQRSHQFTG